MPRALAVPIRQTIVARQRQGQDAATISADLQLHLRTVQNLMRRFRETPDAVMPRYAATPRPPHPLLQTILDYRRDHPTWGPS